MRVDQVDDGMAIGPCRFRPKQMKVLQSAGFGYQGAEKTSNDIYGKALPATIYGSNIYIVCSGHRIPLCHSFYKNI